MLHKSNHCRRFFNLLDSLITSDVRKHIWFRSTPLANSVGQALIPNDATDC